MYINIYITCNNIYTFINQLLPQVSLHFRFLVGNSLVSPKFPPGQIKIGMAWRTWRNNIASVSFLDPQNGGNHHITPKARQSIHDTLYIHLFLYSPKSSCCIDSSFPATKQQIHWKKPLGSASFLALSFCAPAASRTRTTSIWPLPTAQCKGVAPRKVMASFLAAQKNGGTPYMPQNFTNGIQKTSWCRVEAKRNPVAKGV